jgi:hypothetical protein
MRRAAGRPCPPPGVGWGRVVSPSGPLARRCGRPAGALGAGLVLLAVLSPASAVAQAGSSEREPTQESEAWRAHRLDLELALFPSFTQRQIEGPGRDDVVVNEPQLALVAAATYRVLEWLEAGLYLHLDLGSSERVLFSAPDETGAAAEVARIDGAFWELWTALLVRFRYGSLFAELGWAPLMVRHDTSRTDLPNAGGDAGGLFVGSRSVAFLLGLGGRLPLMDRLDLTLRLELRIRYLVERGGEPLAGDAEFGQMSAWPFVGLAYRF